MNLEKRFSLFCGLIASLWLSCAFTHHFCTSNKDISGSNCNKHHKNIVIFLFADCMHSIVFAKPFFCSILFQESITIYPKVSRLLVSGTAGFYAIPASAILWMGRHDCLKNWLFSVNFQFSLSVFLLAPLAVYFSTLADRVLMFFIPLVPLGYFYLFNMFSNFLDRQLLYLSLRFLCFFILQQLSTSGLLFPVLPNIGSHIKVIYFTYPNNL